MLNPFEVRRTWGALVICVCAALPLQGCAVLRAYDGTIKGRVTLQGRGSNQHGGISVTVDGRETTSTSANGDYQIICRVNGPDDFVLYIHKDGYIPRVLNGKFPNTSSAKRDVEVAMESITLAPNP